MNRFEPVSRDHFLALEINLNYKMTDHSTKKRKRTSKVWEYFRQETKILPIICKIPDCQKEYAVNVCTSTLASHLFRQHNIVLNQHQEISPKTEEESASFSPDIADQLLVRALVDNN